MKSEIGDQFLNSHAFINFVPNEEMSSDLQKKLKKINKLPDGLYETKFKIDRYKFDRALKSKLTHNLSMIKFCFLTTFDQLFFPIQTSF